MSIAEALKIEGKLEATFQFVKGLLKMGMASPKIAFTFDLPRQKVDEIIAQINK